jgi:hypothetical protein
MTEDTEEARMKVGQEKTKKKEKLETLVNYWAAQGNHH